MEMKYALLALCGATALVFSTAANADPAPLTKAEVEALMPPAIVGKDPSGATGVDVRTIVLSDADKAAARERKIRVAIVMQSMDVDWCVLQVKGITDTINSVGGEVIGVVDPAFKVDRQVAGIENMIQQKPDAIISIPVDDTATAPAYKKVAEAGIKLILMDNVPRGLKYPNDYQSMISSDNKGDGQVAAQILERHIPQGGTVGKIGFGVDFFVTAERENGFTEWMEANRPDVKIKRTTFLDPGEAGTVAANFITANPDISGIFTVWETPALGAVSAFREGGRQVPVTSVNLALDVAMEMANAGLIRGVGAQLPYDQGVGEATAAIKAILGQQVPQWIVAPALPVSGSNVLDGYKAVFHTEPPKELIDACTSAGVCK
jgi:ribose transport system substrate-binding protein